MVCYEKEGENLVVIKKNWRIFIVIVVVVILIVFVIGMLIGVFGVNRLDKKDVD